MQIEFQKDNSKMSISTASPRPNQIGQNTSKVVNTTIQFGKNDPS